MYAPPYPPPQAYGAPYPTMALKRGVGGLGTAVSILFGIDAAVLLAKAVAFGWRFALLTKLDSDPASVSDQTIKASDNFAQAMSGFHILFFLAIGVVFLCWLWAARTNAEVYAPGRLSMGRGWAIGGWFVPLGNFVIPSIVARDVHRATMEGRSKKQWSGGTVTGVWWGLYLAATALSAIATFVRVGHTLPSDPDYLRALKNSAAVDCVGDLVLLAAAIMAIVYVQRVTSVQKARNAELGSGFAPGYGTGYPGAPMQPGFGYPMAGAPQGYGYPTPGQAPAPGYGPPPPGYGPMPGQPPMPGFQPMPPPIAVPVAVPVPVPVPEYQPVTSPAPAPTAVETPSQDVVPTETRDASPSAASQDAVPTQSVAAEEAPKDTIAPPA